MRIVSDILYSDRPCHPLAMDLYVPDGCPPRAIIAFAHGGGFYKGTRRSGTILRIAERLGQDGYAMAALDYRLGTPLSDFSPADQGRILKNRNRSRRAGVTLAKRLLGPAFEAARQDIGAAIGFLRQNRARWRVASDRIGMIGVSAGAIAGLALAFPPRGLVSCAKPDAVVALAGTLAHPWRLGPDAPPCMILHSARDRIIPYHTAVQSAKRARKVGAPLTLVTCARAGHNAPVQALLEDRDPAGTPYWTHLQSMFETLNPPFADV